MSVTWSVFHNDCLEAKRENYQNCSVLCRVGQLCAMVRIVDSDGPKEAQVQLYSPGGANAPTWESTLAPPDEYD